MLLCEVGLGKATEKKKKKEKNVRKRLGLMGENERKREATIKVEMIAVCVVSN